MKCALCPSNDYLINLTPLSYELDVEQVYYCVSCLNFSIRLAFGKHYIEVLKRVQELDDLKYQVNQKDMSIERLIKDSLEGKDIYGNSEE